jgi:hypothetical protein
MWLEAIARFPRRRARERRGAGGGFIARRAGICPVRGRVSRRSASTSECAGMDLSGHQSSAHREAVHGDVDARFLHSSGTQEGAHVVGSFVSAACVLWQDALGHALSIRLEHVSLSIPFAPAHHPTGSFCLHRSIPSIYLGRASRPQ